MKLLNLNECTGVIVYCDKKRDVNFLIKKNSETESPLMSNQITENKENDGTKICVGIEMEHKSKPSDKQLKTLKAFLEVLKDRFIQNATEIKFSPGGNCRFDFEKWAKENKVTYKKHE